jgi:hypothetical protein
MDAGAPVRSRRQAGLTGLYLGLFATVWFSVPAAGGALRVLLVVASIAALLTVVAGITVLVRAGRPAPGGRDRATDRRYLLVVAAEFAAAGLGALLLSVAGRPSYIPVLVAFVVGVHFFPLVEVLRDPRLRLLGTVVCAVALVALVAGLATSVASGLVAGIGTGAALLGYAILALATAAR